jgi:hypothetical protein
MTLCKFPCRTYVPSASPPTLPRMFHRRIDLGQRTLSGVDLAIDFATLGEYGLVPASADGSCRERADRRPRINRRPGWEALAATRRGACGTGAESGGRRRTDWRFPGPASSRADFRAALARYAA